MTSSEANDLLTRVGPGTRMGNLMRQFWVPACLASELTPDGAPMRLLLLGEQLIAFRDTDGRVGIMEHRCPHRCASLFFGRNEEGGLRCVYHGWKFDVEGNCVDMPNVPPAQDFKHRIKAKAYRTAERNGVIYAYMGQQAEAPPLPQLEALLLPADMMFLSCTQRQCNWLQALEGDIDTSHFGFLHLGSVTPEAVDQDNLHFAAVVNRAPEYHCHDTEWGTTYCAYRSAGPGSTYYRFSNFHLPFWTQFPDGTFENHIVAQAWVPMDDTHTMVFTFVYKKRTPALRTLKDGTPVPGLELDAAAQRPPMLPHTADWYGRWRPQMNKSNDYLLDRDAQRTSSFSGLSSVPIQDQAIIESMGEIVDRSLEHLSASDIMVTRTRRRLAEAARQFAEQGILPRSAHDPSISRRSRSGSFIASNALSWEQALADELDKAQSPTGILQAAE
jgi:phthalate 4,5-dioxygenase oxygenase subunit